MGVPRWLSNAAQRSCSSWLKASLHANRAGGATRSLRALTRDDPPDGTPE